MNNELPTIENQDANNEQPRIIIRVQQILDIRNKVLRYLIIQYLEEQIIINIGEKTYTAVNNLITEAQLHLTGIKQSTNNEQKTTSRKH